MYSLKFKEYYAKLLLIYQKNLRSESEKLELPDTFDYF